MSEIESVDVTEAIGLASGKARLIDVREPDEWNAGHAPQAYSLPLSQLNDRMAELSLDDDLLIICHSGARSLRAATALAASGYSAINVTGGMLAWVAAGGDVVADGPATAAR